MEILEEKYLSANKEEIDSKQILVECVINLNQGEQIEKVLALTADANVTNAESFERETKVAGEIFVNFMFLTPEREIGSLSSVSTFADSVKHDSLAQGQKSKADVKIVGINPTSIGENAFRVLVTVEVALTMEGNASVETFQNTNPNNCTKEANFTLNVLTQDVSGNFSSEKSIVVKEGVNKVLVASSGCILRQVDAGAGFVSVQGDVYTYLSYVKHDGGLVHTQVVNPFKEELEVDNANKESVVEAYLKVKQAETTVTLSEKEEGTEILVNTPLTAYIKVYDNREYSFVSDVYSLTNELEIAKTSFSNTQVFAAKYFEGKIEGNLTLNENQARVDKVLTVSAPNLTISNHYVLDGEIFVHGIVHANVVYLNDEENSINSVELEVPFSTSEKINNEQTDLLSKVQACLSDCDVIAKRGREIYFDCKIKVYANLWHKETKEVIAKVTDGRKFEARDSAIEIYFAHTGETVWDIAKELKVTTDLIMGQNPLLTSPLESNERVVVYYGIE